MLKFGGCSRLTRGDVFVTRESGRVHDILLPLFFYVISDRARTLTPVLFFIHLSQTQPRLKRAAAAMCVQSFDDL
jgi:hypothetical protein